MASEIDQARPDRPNPVDLFSGSGSDDTAIIATYRYDRRTGHAITACIWPLFSRMLNTNQHGFMIIRKR
jgi:hypothetical protein